MSLIHSSKQMCHMKTHKTNINFPFLPTLQNLIAFRGQLNTTEWDPIMEKYLSDQLVYLNNTQ
jgi:hypothetical protein